MPCTQHKQMRITAEHHIYYFQRNSTLACSPTANTCGTFLCLSFRTCIFNSKHKYQKWFPLKFPKQYIPSKPIGCRMTPISNTCYFAHHFLVNPQVRKSQSLYVLHAFISPTSSHLLVFSTPRIPSPCHRSLSSPHPDFPTLVLPATTLQRPHSGTSSSTVPQEHHGAVSMCS